MLEKPQWDQGFDVGYNTGYDTGYKNGRADSARENAQVSAAEKFEKGFLEGWSYSDSEKEACREITALKIINEEMAAIIRESLRKHRPLAVITIGDGEVLTLSQEMVLSTAEVRWRGPFLGYAGVEIPDLKARDNLAAAIVQADYVGLSDALGANFQPLLLRALRSQGIDYHQLHICDPVFNYELFKKGLFQDILLHTVPKPVVLLVGNKAPELQAFFKGNGVTLTEPVYPVRGFNDIARVFAEIQKRQFDIALVSAGIATTVICVTIRRELGKVALKFGHLADELITGAKNW